MDGFEKLLALTLRFLAFRPRSEKEIVDYLKTKEYSQKEKDNVFSYLISHNLLDDEEFTRWFIDQRTRVRPKGIRLITLELKQKGINQDIIDKVFSSQDREMLSQAESAKMFIQKRLSRYTNLPKRELYQKLGTLLLRRGFDWETIKRSIDEVLQDW